MLPPFLPRIERREDVHLHAPQELPFQRDGKPVQADAFARAISRMLIPGMKSPGAEYAKDIVGAEAVTAGTRTVSSGVTAKGTRLVIRFTRPIPDFPLRTTMPFFCAVPPGLP